METNISKTSVKDAIQVDSIIRGQFQKNGTKTAMLRQKVTNKSKYPSAVHNSNMQRNPFSTSDFTGDTEKEFTSFENRVAFIDIPEDATIDDVQAKIPVDACLYKTMSNTPILTNNHRNAISRGLTTLDKLADSQVVRYGDNDPDGNAGKLILDSAGRVQYRKIFYWDSEKADIDLRGHEDHPEFKSVSIIAEQTVEPAIVLENQEQEV